MATNFQAAMVAKVKASAFNRAQTSLEMAAVVVAPKVVLKCSPRAWVPNVLELRHLNLPDL